VSCSSIKFEDGKCWPCPWPPTSTSYTISDRRRISTNRLEVRTRKISSLRRRETEGGKIECGAFLPDIEILDPMDSITSCMVHQKKMTRTRRARAENTMPMLTARMTTAWSGVRSEIDRLGMVKISSWDSPSRAPCTRVTIHERPARDSGPSLRQAAPRRPSLATWDILGRPFPSRTLRSRFLSSQRCPDKLQSKSSCGDPISQLRCRGEDPFDDPLPMSNFTKSIQAGSFLQNHTVSFT
jgi:hypothetical protein